MEAEEEGEVEKDGADDQRRDGGRHAGSEAFDHGRRRWQKRCQVVALHTSARYLLVVGGFASASAGD